MYVSCELFRSKICRFFGKVIFRVGCVFVVRFGVMWMWEVKIRFKRNLDVGGDSFGVRVLC